MTSPRGQGSGGPAVDTACVEARGLVLGLRRAWRLRLPSASLKPWRRAWRGHGLHLTMSQQRFEVVQGGVLRVVDRGLGERGVHLVVISSDPEFARACLAEELRNVARGAATDRGQLQATLESHRRLGAAYGYPACCVEAFCDAHVETVIRRHRRRLKAGDGGGDTASVVQGDNGLAIARAAARSASFDPLLAAIPGALGVSAASTLRHLPCRFDCAASRRLADALLQDMATADSQRYRRLKRGLTRPVLIDEAGHATLAVSARRRRPWDQHTLWQVDLGSNQVVEVSSYASPGRPELPLLLPFHTANPPVGA